MGTNLNEKEAKQAIIDINSAILNVEIIKNFIKKNNESNPEIYAVLELIKEHNENQPDKKISFNEFLFRDLDNWDYVSKVFTEYKNLLKEKYDL